MNLDQPINLQTGRTENLKVEAFLLVMILQIHFSANHHTILHIVPEFQKTVALDLERRSKKVRDLDE